MPSSGSVPTPLKSRRDHFEAQLQALQSDIAALSVKLSGAADGAPLPANRPSRDDKPAHMSSSNSLEGASSDSGDAESDAPVPIGISKKASANAKLRGQVARLQKELRAVVHERDESRYGAEQLQRENEDLRRAVAEFQKIHGLYDHLKMDYDSLALSLESSDRIRRQQKELIEILQQQLQRNDNSFNGANSFSTSADISFGRLSSRKPPLLPASVGRASASPPAPRLRSSAASDAGYMSEASECISDSQYSKTRVKSSKRKKQTKPKDDITPEDRVKAKPTSAPAMKSASFLRSPDSRRPASSSPTTSHHVKPAAATTTNTNTAAASASPFGASAKKKKTLDKPGPKSKSDVIPVHVSSVTMKKGKKAKKSAGELSSAM